MLRQSLHKLTSRSYNTLNMIRNQLFDRMGDIMHEKEFNTPQIWFNKQKQLNMLEDNEENKVLRNEILLECKDIEQKYDLGIYDDALNDLLKEYDIIIREYESVILDPNQGLHK